MSNIRHHRNPSITIALAILFMVGLTCWVVSSTPYLSIRKSLDSLAGDGSAAPYTESLHNHLQWAFLAIGVCLIGLAAVLQFSRTRWERDFIASVKQSIGDSKGLLRKWVTRIEERKFSLTAVILAGSVLRLLYLQQPIRYDEAHSFLEYSSQPWFVTVAKYTEPNNHVGHNLLVHISTQLLGDSEAVIRLPALLAGILMIPFTFLLARQFSSASGAAIFAAAVVATSSPLIEYSTNARGYTLVGLFTLIAWICADEIRETGNRAAIAGLILSGAYGLWVVPVMLYPLSMIFAWAILTPQNSRSQTFAVVKRFQSFFGYGIGIILLTLVFYLPILLVEGLGALIANPYVESLSWVEFGERFSEAAFSTISFLSRDMGLSITGIAFLASLSGVFMCDRRTRLSLLTVLACFLIPVTLLTAQRVVPPERVWLFLIPLGAIFAGAGLQQIWKKSPFPNSQIAGWGLASLAICIWPSIQMIANDSVATSQETGAVPEAREIVRFLADQLPDQIPVIAVTPCSAPIKYYARLSELGMHHFERPENHGSLNSQTAVLVLSKTSPQTIDSTLESLNLDEIYSPGKFQPWKQFPTTTVYRYYEPAK